jgi:hypothetical protein
MLGIEFGALEASGVQDRVHTVSSTPFLRSHTQDAAPEVMAAQCLRDGMLLVEAAKPSLITVFASVARVGNEHLVAGVLLIGQLHLGPSTVVC